MRIFVDEDTGANVGRALRAVGVAAQWVASDSAIKPGTPDEVWIPLAGRQGMLVLSRNTGILESDAQRNLVILHQVGIVFVPAHLNPLALLRLVLRKWEWLEAIDAEEPRPFAFILSASGRARRLPLSM